MGVHARIDEEVYAELTEASSNLSYRKAGKSIGEVEISRQTAMNSVRSIEKLKLEKLAGEKKTIEVLYVEADEDHIALKGYRILQGVKSYLINRQLGRSF